MMGWNDMDWHVPFFCVCEKIGALHLYNYIYHQSAQSNVARFKVQIKMGAQLDFDTQ